MPNDASTLVRKLRQQAAAHIKAGRILRDMAARIEKQRRAGDQLAHLVQDVETDVLIVQATHHLQTISQRAVAEKSATTRSKNTSQPVAVAPKRSVKNPPQIAAMASSLLRALFGGGRLPTERTLGEALAGINKGTISPKLARGHLDKAVGYLNNHVLEESLDQGPAYIARLYRDLEFSRRREKILEVLKKWEVAIADAKPPEAASA